MQQRTRCSKIYGKCMTGVVVHPRSPIHSSKSRAAQVVICGKPATATCTVLCPSLSIQSDAVVAEYPNLPLNSATSGSYNAPQLLPPHSLTANPAEQLV